MFWNKTNQDAVIEKLKQKISILEVEIASLQNKLKEFEGNLQFFQSNFNAFRRKALKLDVETHEEPNEKYKNDNFIPM